MEFKGHPALEEFSILLQNESPRCAVIVAAAFLDETLGKLLGGSKQRFGPRIDQSLAWGILSANEAQDLHVLQELRNDFAHDLRARDFWPAAIARIESLKLWQTANKHRPLERVVQAPLHILLYVIGTIGFRLQSRLKPAKKAGPLPEPAINDWPAWPPVISHG